MVHARRNLNHDPLCGVAKKFAVPHSVSICPVWRILLSFTQLSDSANTENNDAHSNRQSPPFLVHRSVSSNPSFGVVSGSTKSDLRSWLACIWACIGVYVRLHVLCSIIPNDFKVYAGGPDVRADRFLYQLFEPLVLFVHVIGLNFIIVPVVDQ